MYDCNMYSLAKWRIIQYWCKGIDCAATGLYAFRFIAMNYHSFIVYDPSLFLFFSWVCQCNIVCFYSVHNENILRRSICFQHHACFSIAIELAEIWFVLKIPPNYWKQWLVLRRNEKMSCQGQSHSLVLTKDKRDKGATGICGKNCRHLPKCEIWQSCIDICVKNIGQIFIGPQIILFLEIVGKS